MTTKTCGCTTETCGCCEGIQAVTPQSTVNRPGLGALSYRVGTHGAFLETMKARLSTMTVDVPSADGQTTETYTPLRALTTRDTGDFSIALLDGWATVADVLTFYQERIANEGFLRTATEPPLDSRTRATARLQVAPRRGRRRFIWPTRSTKTKRPPRKFPPARVRRAFRDRTNWRRVSRPAIRSRPALTGTICRCA